MKSLENEVDVTEFVAALPKKPIYWTIGVYNDGSMKHNGVDASDVLDHIHYNITMRPGRALFVEGECVHRGYLDEKRAHDFEAHFSKHFKEFHNTSKPYR